MTAGVIISTTVPLNGQAAVDTGPVVDPLPVLNDLSKTATFNIPAAEDTVLASITGQKTGSVLTISPNDGRVKFSGGNYVRGPSAYTTAGTTVFTITETFTNTLGQSVTKDSTLTVTAVAPVVVVPGNATVKDAIGRKTISGVKIAQLPAGASLSGTGSTHFSVDALGQVTVNNVGAAYTTSYTAPASSAAPNEVGTYSAAANTGGANAGAGLNASYSMTVVGGGSVTSLAFNTLANEFTANTSAEVMASFAALKLSLSLDQKIALPTGTTLSSYVRLQGARFTGATVDANKNLLPQDVDPKGFSSAGVSLWAGLNGKQAYDSNAVASVSGGSLTIYCPTTMGAKIDALMWIIDVTPIRFENLDFVRMSPVDMHDTKATAPYYVTRQAVLAPATLSATGGITSFTFLDQGAGYQPGYKYDVTKLSGNGSGVNAKVTANAAGQLDPVTVTFISGGSGYDSASRIWAYQSQFWDPDQRVNGVIPADMPNNKFYQLFTNSAQAGTNQDGVTADNYMSIVIRKCRFGIGSRTDVPSVLRYNRCLNIVNHNHLVLEDCLFDAGWEFVGHTRFVRTDMRRNAFRRYVNDILDTYPTTADGNGAGGRYATLPAPFRSEGVFFRTDNYTGPPDQTDLRFSNSHSDDHQHGAGGDLQTQNVLFANNFVNMNCSSKYITTQGYFDNGDSTAAKRAKVKFNFLAASTTNSCVTSYTDTTDPNGTVVENNFVTRTIYGPDDLGGGVDGVGGGANIIKLVKGTIIRRNTIKSVWDMGPGNGGDITFNPPGGVMMGQTSSTPSPTSTLPRTFAEKQPDNSIIRKPTGDVYVLDNYFLSYLTPNTGAGDSYPEVLKNVNAVGQGPAFIWDGTLGFTGPGNGKVSIGFQRWWELVRDTPSTSSWADNWAAVARGKADIQSIFTPLAGSGADGRHCFPAAVF